MSQLSVRGLKMSYGAARVLFGVDVDVHHGELVGLAGRNGAGKTTTLRAISGMIKREAAELTLDGVPLPARPEAVARAGVIHVPEGRQIFRTLSVEENLRFGCHAAGKGYDRTALEEVLSFFPKLKPLLHRPGGLLSGGEQQMLAIGRGLMAQPKLLLVDELSLGLSPKATLEVMDALVQTCKQKRMSLFIVDQNVRSLAGVCDRLYVLSRGRTELMDPTMDQAKVEQVVYFS